MNYGWLCRKCGSWRHSDEKVVIGAFKREHRKVGCTFIKRDGVLRRPDLD